MADKKKITPAQGRTPPPPEKHFLKGQSGNPAGRPKGTVSIKGITRKVARKTRRMKIDGKFRKISTSDLLILKLNSMAALGKPGTAAVVGWLRDKVTLPEETASQAGILLVPAEVTPEEFMAEMEICNIGKVKPGTEVDVEHEEYMKAVRGEPSPLGEAIRAFHKKNRRET
jgi:hypothetical protein